MVVSSNTYYDIDTVKAAARNRWAEIHEAAGIPVASYTPGKQGPCPKQCLKAGSDKPGGVDRFCLYDDYHTTGGCRCRVCDQYCGTGIDTLMWWHSWTLSESLGFVAKHLGIKPGGSHNPYVVSGNGCGAVDASTEHQQTDEPGGNDVGKEGPQPVPSKHAGPDFLVSRTAPGVHVAWDQVDGQTQHTKLYADLLAKAKPGIDPDAVPGAAIGLYWIGRYRTLGFLVRDPVNLDQLTGAQLIRVEGYEFPAAKGQESRKRHTLKGGKDGFIIFADSLGGAPAQFKAANRVWIVEGPTDGLAAARRVPDGDIVISTVGGAESVPEGAEEALTGKEVILIRDDDQAGDKGLNRWIATIYDVVESAHVAKLPEGCGDLREAIGGGHVLSDLKLRCVTDEEAAECKETTKGKQSAPSPPPPPLHNTEALGNAQEVVIVDGEADAVAGCKTGFVFTSPPDNSLCAIHANWTPLAGKAVVVTSCDSQQGEDFAYDVVCQLAKLDPTCTIRVLKIAGHADFAGWINARQHDMHAAHTELRDLIDGTSPINSDDLDSYSDPRPNDAVDNPHYLAEAYLRQFGTVGQERILWNWRDEWWRYDGTGYVQVPKAEIETQVMKVARQTFKEKNIEDMKRADSPEKAEKLKCKPVTVSLTRNVTEAIRSEVFLSGAINQPHWIDETGPFPANEVLATKSGLIHVPSLVDGKKSLINPTSNFFSANTLPLAFAPNATCPQWEQFLHEVFDGDQERVNTLAQWFGYCLLPDTSQHKILMLVGPPRSGKGTIGKILHQVVGERNTATPTLNSLMDQFGLQGLVNKTIALIGDARLSGRDPYIILERLLSISGEDRQDVARKFREPLTAIHIPIRFTILTNQMLQLPDEAVP